MIRKILSNKALNFGKQSIPKNNFCIYQAYLNPERHINTTHNINNVYEDIVLLGDNIMPTQLNEANLSTTYVPKILDVTVAHLNKKYNLKLDAKNYNEYYQSQWEDLGILDIEADKQELLDSLAKSVFIKEHKLRWPAEQRERLAHTSEVYSYIDLNDFYVGYFFESYNTLLQQSIERSNLWESNEIRGEQSALEKYNQDHSQSPTGVPELNNSSGNVINRFMEIIHKL